MRSKVRKRAMPIILNYTGAIIKIHLRKDEDRFKSQNGNELLLPPLGNPSVEIVKKYDIADTFLSEIHIIHGIPPPMFGILYIVQDHIAKLLYGTRNDMLILVNKRAESTENILKPEEMMLVGDDLAYFSVEFVSN